MLPASNRGVGQMFGMPDVCLTPTPAGPVPVPYPNIGMNAQASGFSTVVKISGMNALNMGSTVTMTTGDEAGSAHPTIKGQGRYTMGSPIVSVDKLPAINLTCPTTGNMMNNAAGAVLVPSAVNVTYCEAPRRPTRPGDIGARLGDTAVLFRLDRVTVRAVAEVSRLLHDVDPQTPLVMDLRGCPGGEADGALRLVDRFLAYGTPLVVLEEGDGDHEVLRARSRQHERRSLILLVDGGTASAAEIVAGCLAYHDRAVVLGERTYGKSSGRCASRRVTYRLVDGRPVGPVCPSQPRAIAQLSMRAQAVCSSLIESGSI